MAVITDSVADMLTRIRNAMERRHKFVSMPSSKMRVAIAEIMREEGFIEDFEVIETKPQNILKVWPKYTEEDEPVITGMERVSKPGRRIYKRRDEIPWVLSGMGVAILTTSRGVMTGRNARREGVGGEVLCYIW